MEWNLSTGAATVVISGMALIFAIIQKFFPTRKGLSDESFSSGIKAIMISQNDLLARQTTTLALMQQKINGSHDKIDDMSKLLMLLPKQLNDIERIVSKG